MNGEGFLPCEEEERKHLNSLERKAFLEAAMNLDSLHDRSFCLTLLFTGCRISEALALTPASVDVTEGTLIVRTLKQRDAVRFRHIPIDDFLIDELVKHIEELSCEPDEQLWRFSRTTAWSRIKKCMKEVRIEGIRAVPKGLRHGYAVGKVDDGTPLSILKYLMGHTELTSTMIYLHMSSKERRKWAQRDWDMLLYSQ